MRMRVAMHTFKFTASCRLVSNQSVGSQFHLLKPMWHSRPGCVPERNTGEGAGATQFSLRQLRIAFLNHSLFRSRVQIDIAEVRRFRRQCDRSDGLLPSVFNRDDVCPGSKITEEIGAVRRGLYLQGKLLQPDNRALKRDG